jgi:hypothetical protein
MAYQTDGAVAVRNDAHLAIEDIVRRVQSEFLEMPGLRLTDAQAQRLWGLDARTCSVVIDKLIACRFLFRTRDGAVMRIDATE